MKTLRGKLLSFLLPAVFAIGFLAWWYSPTQTVIRTTKAVIDTFQVRALSVGSRSDQTKRFAGHLSPLISVTGPDPIPSQEIEAEELLEYHERYQTYLRSSHVSSSDYDITFPRENEAKASFNALADVQMHGGSRNVMQYEVTFTYEKSGKSWLLKEIWADLR